jgi:Zn-dependent protease with chaperone function
MLDLRLERHARLLEHHYVTNPQSKWTILLRGCAALWLFPALFVLAVIFLATRILDLFPIVFSSRSQWWVAGITLFVTIQIGLFLFYFMKYHEGEAQGLLVKRAEAQKLFSRLDSIATRLGVPKLDQISIEHDFNGQAATTKKYFWFGPMSRTLTIGHMCFNELSEPEMDALLTHELAHFTENQAGNLIVSRAVQFWILLERYSGANSGLLCALLNWLSTLVLKWIVPSHLAVYRLDEFEADSAAALFTAPEIATSLSAKMEVLSPIWNKCLSSLLEVGSEKTRDFVEGPMLLRAKYRALKAELDLEHELMKLLSTEETLLASHPSFLRRYKNVGGFTPKEWPTTNTRHFLPDLIWLELEAIETNFFFDAWHDQKQNETNSFNWERWQELLQFFESKQLPTELVTEFHAAAEQIFYGTPYLEISKRVVDQCPKSADAHFVYATQLIETSDPATDYHFGKASELDEHSKSAILTIRANKAVNSCHEDEALQLKAQAEEELKKLKVHFVDMVKLEDEVTLVPLHPDSPLAQTVQHFASSAESLFEEVTVLEKQLPSYWPFYSYHILLRPTSGANTFLKRLRQKRLLKKLTALRSNFADPNCFLVHILDSHSTIKREGNFTKVRLGSMSRQ